MSDSRPRITPIQDGPLRVEGLKQIETKDGAIDCKSGIALCRCGRSDNKPFCDGTHAKIGFDSKTVGGPNPDRRDDYVGKTITIHDNRAICAHAGFCTDGLSSVFRMNTEPWIDPDGATAQEIIAIVQKCPSGALSYSVDGVEHRDDSASPPSVFVAPSGPYAVKGGCELVDAQWGVGASEEHFDLCRCGGSKNKPFCDGSHWTVWENGEDSKPPAAGAEGQAPEAVGQAPEAMGLAPEAKGLSSGTKGPRPTPEEPYVAYIHELAENGLSKLGPDGPVGAMGVPRTELPTWDHIQIMTAQLDPRPLQEEDLVGTDLVIGPKARKPLHLDIPLFVSDMSFGALSEEAKVALSKGAELAGTGICSGEGGMLPEEHAENSRYFYEYASGKFGFKEEKLARVQAMHFKGGQGAKTGTGGHLPGSKVVGKIAEVRGLEPGMDSISPATFTDLFTPSDFKRFGDRARELSGGIPIGFKLSANRIERDITWIDVG